MNEKVIVKWMHEHRGFMSVLSHIDEKIQNGAWEYDDLNETLIKELLQDYRLHIDFSEKELLRVWQRQKAVS